jgi:hypothetical protein
MHADSPWPPAPRPKIAVEQNPPEHRQSSTTVRPVGKFAGKLASPVSLPQIHSYPLDLNPKIQNRSLNRRVTGWSGPSKHHKILRLKFPIRPNRYGPVEKLHVASLWSEQFSNRFSNQNWSKSCKNHIFCSVGPKITNVIPLESLWHLESSGSIKPYILWVQFEINFKLCLNLLLACLIHIYWTRYPKITIL